MRRPAEPNKREQDGDKHPILCEVCEQRFGRRESQFNSYIFKAFHENDKAEFVYGDWFHYFLTSIAWRTLIMDLADPSTVARIPSRVLSELREAEATMRRYLLGEVGLASLIRNHVFFLVQGDVVSPELAAAGPNFLIRRSVGGYTLWTNDGYSAIIHNLAGVMCVTLIRGNPQDTWDNTKVSPKGGRIKPPQRVRSWIAHDFFGAIIEFSKTNQRMSNKQLSVVEAAIARNPKANSLRFREADRRLN